MINLRNALMTGKRLPYDAEVEYLESTGTQYINTGLNYFADFEITVKLRESVSNVTLKSGSFNRFERNSDTNPNWRFRSAAAGIYNTTVPITELHTLTWKDGKTYSDGNFLQDWTKNFPSGWMYVFGDTSAQYPAMVYALKLWDANGSLVRDYIPVRKGTTGELYDRVSGKFAERHGDFQYGPDVVPVEWLGFDGSQYINTELTVKSTLRITCDVRIDDVCRMFGGRTESGSNQFDLFQYSTTNIRPSYGNRSVNVAGVGTGRHTFDFNQNTFSVDGVVKQTFTAQTFSSPSPIYIGAVSTNDSGTVSSSKLIGRLYITDIHDGDPVRKFRPVRVGTDATSWEGAMMDVLTRRIYRNAGTGAFTFGNDLKYPIPAE